MSSVTIHEEFSIDSVLTDLDSMPCLSDPTGTFGVKRNDTGAVVVADGTTFTSHPSAGVYEFSFAEPDVGLTYTYWVEWVYGGQTYRDEHILVREAVPARETVSDPYCTISEVKAVYSDITKTDVEYQAAIDWACTLIDRLTHDHFAPIILTLNIPGSSSTRLELYPYTYLRCLSVTSVIDVPTGESIDPTTFLVKDRFLEMVESVTIRAGLSDVWPKGSYNIQVVGSFGWVAIPLAVTRAAILLATEIVKNPSGSVMKLALTSESFGDYSYSGSLRNDNLVKVGIPEVDSVISMYVNRFIAITAI